MKQGSEYRSTIFVPMEAAKRARVRASTLGLPVSQIANAVIILAAESGGLPDVIPELPDDGDRQGIPFALPLSVVERLGGRDAARGYARWAIMEGLDKSPLASPS